MKFSFNPYNINRLTLIAAEASVKDDAYYQRCRNSIIKNREYTVEALKKLGFCVLESQANFIFVKPGPLTGLEYYSKLRDDDILVRYFDKERIRDFVRITIGTAIQMQKLISVTEKILKERA
jgi:histidinol-phosphate aminotransferase